MQKIKDVEIENVGKFENVSILTQSEIKSAFGQVLEKIDRNIEAFNEKFPDACSVNNVYPIVENTSWTSGFWTGMLWLAYDMTKEEKYRKVAEKYVLSFKDRMKEKRDVDHHDLGFLYTLSCVSSYKLTGNVVAKETALQAAEHLLGRYHLKGEFIQAWGDINDPSAYRLIIDCLMNLPLLYWATEVTGDEKFHSTAYKHLKTTMATVFRENASTFHTFYFNPENGQPLKGATHQGYTDESCWARGQAWGIYGLPLSYIYTRDEGVKEIYKKVVNYYLNHLPKDNVCYWDLIFTSGGEVRDSSAAAIAICGMLEMNKWLDNADSIKNIYNNAVQLTLRSLIEKYTTKDMPDSNGLLIHAVYSKPHNMGVDECNIWGDYFYMEALVRIMKEWSLFW